MKACPTITVCLIAISFHSAAYGNPSPLLQIIEMAQTQNINSNDSIEVAVSEKVRVLLKKGEPLGGNLIRLTKQDLVLAVGNQQKSLAIDNVQSIEFQGDVWIVSSGKGRIRIRGQERQTRQQRTWTDVPLDNLKVQPNAKTAVIRLGSVIRPEDLRDLRSQLQDVIYVLDKIEFEPSGQKITVKATPIDRRLLR